MHTRRVTIQNNRIQEKTSQRIKSNDIIHIMTSLNTYMYSSNCCLLIASCQIHDMLRLHVYPSQSTISLFNKITYYQYSLSSYNLTVLSYKLYIFKSIFLKLLVATNTLVSSLNTYSSNCYLLMASCQIHGVLRLHGHPSRSTISLLTKFHIIIHIPHASFLL